MKYFCYDCQKVYDRKNLTVVHRYNVGNHFTSYNCPKNHTITYQCRNALRLRIFPIDNSELFSDCDDCNFRFKCYTGNY